MKRPIWFLFALLFCASLFAAGSIYTDVVSFDDSASGNTLTPGFTFHSADIKNNDSADALYCAVDSNATVSPHVDHVSMAIAHGDTYRWRSGTGATTINCVCDTGQTCSNSYLVIQP